jgi:thioredoxin 1
MIHGTDKTFDVDVLQKKGLVLVDFWAPWCGPCLSLGPKLEAIDEQYPDLTVVKINIDEHFETATKYNVKTIPTILLFEDGIFSVQHVGHGGFEAIKALVDFKLSNK